MENNEKFGDTSYVIPNYLKLLEKINESDANAEDKEDDLEWAEEEFDRFRKYFNAVYEHVIGGEVQRTLFSMGRIEREDMIDRIMRYDDARKKEHNAAMVAANALNRLCELYDSPAICPKFEIGEGETFEKSIQRGKLADFVGQFMYNTFQEGIGKPTLDEIIKQENLKYGDRTNLDAAIEIAEKIEKRNPNEAYTREVLAEKINRIRKEKMTNGKGGTNSEAQKIKTNRMS